jgi:hypothetical protein
MSKVALVIIYNHQFNQNIAVLESIYSQRFSNIYHLVPFYCGNLPNVIAVYESSFYFQGYIAQGFAKYYKKDYQHYLFIADDLLLNPCINEDNYTSFLNLGLKSCFIPGFISLHDCDENWARIPEAANWVMRQSGIEINSQLPSIEQALEKFANFNLQIKPLRFNQVWPLPRSIRGHYHTLRNDWAWWVKYIKNRLTISEYNLSFPLVGSYSDIFVASSDTIKMFCHYCGVFAASNLFVELALPTAMVLAGDDIIQEKDLQLSGKALWTKDDYQILQPYYRNLQMLISDFPENFLYLHPVKLSQWDTKLCQNQ